eukprot:CAMPEP_0168346090 /NCGR_PEP_ID=MMETSP0213-20121227/18030_1 /TAXON_ID=151035 /ORGANISM="Euplotes harpa, Strain FSP1.4" /LENGTH=96 /DNA_ID=CAMNT_0008354607 /DNA_START=443 /DNA_END=733 /DNA_ORIENTATION=+
MPIPRLPSIPRTCIKNAFMDQSAARGTGQFSFGQTGQAEPLREEDCAGRPCGVGAEGFGGRAGFEGRFGGEEGWEGFGAGRVWRWRAESEGVEGEA